ncbi:neprilysin-4-like [Periplaneta americana]|uniref:neprilysin-4-like n=1 Tax=Periplaneta americana TaxID=6978 RepID=UPI0037E81F21
MMKSYSDEEERSNSCPSCRLAISKDSGRLKWHLCSGREEAEWQQKRRIRMMLLTLLLLILPVGFVLGLVSHMHVNKSSADLQKPDFPTMRVNLYLYDHPEAINVEDRDMMQDVQTKFVPPPTSYYRVRQRRSSSLSDNTGINAWETYQGNVTSDLIIWGIQDTDLNTGALNGGGHVIHSPGKDQHNTLIAKIHKSTNFTSSRSTSGTGKSSEYTEKKTRGSARKKPIHEKFPARNQLREENNTVEHQTLMPDETESEGNSIIENYPDEAIDAEEGIGERNDDKEDDISYNDEIVVKEDGQNFPWKPAEKDTDDDEHQPPGEEEEGEQESYGLGQEAWLALQDKAAEEEQDLNTFWKVEGDYDKIRYAQGKVMASYMDVNVDPCQDFYQYACGNWWKKNPIPKDKAAYDTFEMLRENLDAVLKELLEEPPSTKNRDFATEVLQKDAVMKAKHLYQSCMNYDILEQRSEQPLLNLLDELGGWPILRPDWDSSQFDWILLMAQLRLYNNDILISEWVGPDIKNSDEYVIQFDQTNLGLPTRDYFLQPSNMVYLDAYKNYLIKIATLLGAPLDNATQQAEEIITFEKRLAKITSAPDERRNVSELYQRMSVGELRQLIPQVDWYRYLTLVLARPVNVSEPVVVFALQYIQDLVTLLGKTQPRTTANYLLWRFVRHRVNNLDDRFQDAKQRFYYILFGREQAPPRWKYCVSEVNSHLGMALGALFVRKYFHENSKNDTVQMTEDIMLSFRELLSQTNWIDRETKELASQKVDAIVLRIGYPDFILSPQLLNERYADLVIRPDQFFENTLNILRHATRIEQDRLGTHVNKTLWNTPPAIVNAYYSRYKNQIMFPAGILQPPFYHRYFPRSLNYGGIGVVIGHEITHGFDDKGRLFDKDGNLHRWWRDEAIEGFHRRAQCLIDQYSHYTVQEVSMPLDGSITQGENIADNGGIKQAFRAYQRWLHENGDSSETLPGLNATGHQLFFLNFAQIWCGSIRPEAMRNKLKTAVHAPGKFRVIGTLSNSEDFATVFKCPLGSPMNPVNKCSVW